MAEKTGQDIIIPIIIGPTASGKSAHALERAQNENGIIINADSMQIYDALPVLTARPTIEEQKIVPHKLYGTLQPNDKCTAARWQKMATDEINSAVENKQTPFIVGGTGFYIKALTDGLSPIPEIDETIRETLIRRQKEIGTHDIYNELKAIDPDIEGQIDEHNTQRVLRAAEVFEATGKSLAYWQKIPREKPPKHWKFQYDFIIPERKTIIERINHRFDIMIEQGALDDVKQLDKQIQNGTVSENAPIVVAHGFRALRRYLNGEFSFDEAADYTKTETRRYAKRQATWIRNQIKLQKNIAEQ